MPFREHPVFEEPANKDHVIWRYYDATQFISVLQNRGLYFNRTDNFSDQFEGIFPKERLVKEYKQRIFQHKTREELVDAGILPEEFLETRQNPEKELFDILNAFRYSSYINCWHMNESESMAMWRSYMAAGDGVLIRSTYSKLKESLDMYDDHTYRMGKVGYLPWLDEEVEDELDERERQNYLYPFMYKQEEYKYEQEIRAIIQENIENPMEKAEKGFFVKTDLNNLIDSIIVSPISPPWSNVDFWENICRKYRIWSDVETSSLDTSPEKILEDLDDKEIEKQIEENLERWREEQDFLD